MARFILSAFADEAGSSPEEQISALKRNGIGYIEPRNINGKPILTLTDTELLDFKRMLDENGISVNSLGSPIGKYPIEDDFEPHFADLRKAIHVCEVFETDMMRMFSFFVPDGEAREHRNEVLRRMRLMTDEARQHGITLCHENESRIYGQMPEEVRDLLVSLPDLGGIFDPANYRMHDADVFDGIDATLTNFKYMHIKDAIFADQAIVPAGEGEGHIGDIIDIINDRVEGKVFLTLEPHLCVFDAYRDIDKHELKGKYTFSSNGEAFDFAANALKSLLTTLGYKEGDNHEWIK